MQLLYKDPNKFNCAVGISVLGMKFINLVLSNFACLPLKST